MSFGSVVPEWSLFMVLKPSLAKIFDYTNMIDNVNNKNHFSHHWYRENAPA